MFASVWAFAHDRTQTDYSFGTPTPQRAHYSFSLRDLRRLLQGIGMASPRQIRRVPDLVKLWVHEATRVFGDRLVNDADRAWLAGKLEAAVRGPLRQSSVPDNRTLVYVNFMSMKEPNLRKYEEVTELEKRLVQVRAEGSRALASLRTELVANHRQGTILNLSKHERAPDRSASRESRPISSIGTRPTGRH